MPTRRPTFRSPRSGGAPRVGRPETIASTLRPSARRIVVAIVLLAIVPMTEAHVSPPPVSGWPGGPDAPGGLPVGWSSETVDSGFTLNPSVAFDAGGQPAIAYFSGGAASDLKVARRLGDRWGLETVDAVGDTGRYPSIVFDAQGNALVSYVDHTLGALKLARFDGTEWSITIVDPTTGPSLYTSMALSPDGLPTIAYYGASRDLRVAEFNGTSWARTSVDSTRAGLFASLAFDKSGRPVVAYADGATWDLLVARGTQNGWTTEVVDSVGSVGRSPSLRVAPTGDIVIAYGDFTAASDAWRVKIARSALAGNWTTQTTQANGRDFISLVLDPKGCPQIFFTQGLLEGMKILRSNCVDPSIEAVSRGSGWFASAASDGAGRPVAAYWDPNLSSLQLAQLGIDACPVVRMIPRTLPASCEQHAHELEGLPLSGVD